MKYFRHYFLAAFVAAGHLVSCASLAPQPRVEDKVVLTGRPRVYDGDSLFFGKVEVRLDAIDAPEHDQACHNMQGEFWPCGITARDALRRMAGAGRVQCVIGGTDKYRRLLGVCYASGRDLNDAMVESGNAIAYHYFSEKYAPQESRARAAKRGIWQDAGFTEPYYCRHFERGHTCYVYDFASGTGRVAEAPLTGRPREGSTD